MANLNFYYGTMEAGKTTKLIQDNYNYRRHDFKTLVIKPLIDTKGGDYIITRIGEKVKVDIKLGSEESLFDKKYWQEIIESDFILVDEAQFLNEFQVIELWMIAHAYDKVVNAYGLNSTFKGELFEGSSYLFARADMKYELMVSCLCGKAATLNARRVNNEFVSEGNEVVIDGEFDSVEYIPLCGDCYLKYVENDVLQRKKTKI